MPTAPFNIDMTMNLTAEQHREAITDWLKKHRYEATGPIAFAADGVPLPSVTASAPVQKVKRKEKTAAK